MVIAIDSTFPSIVSKPVALNFMINKTSKVNRKGTDFASHAT